MSGRPLADIVKAGQKSSENWKMKWIQYTAHLSGVRDPMKHDDSILQGFIDQNGAEFASEIWFQQALQGHFPPPRPQQRPPQPNYGGYPGGYAMPMGPGQPLVEAIKAGQRSDARFKEAWWNFCDTYCEGIRDPNRHPMQNLELFLSEHKPVQMMAARLPGLPGLGPTAIGPAGLGGPGGLGPAPRW